jgi:hypothetical protein
MAGPTEFGDPDVAGRTIGDGEARDQFHSGFRRVQNIVDHVGHLCQNQSTIRVMHVVHELPFERHTPALKFDQFWQTFELGSVHDASPTRKVACQRLHLRFIPLASTKAFLAIRFLVPQPESRSG